MSISFSPQQQAGSANLSYHFNANFSKNTLDNRENSEKSHSVNKSNTSLGGKKKSNILKNLMKQKEKLMDSKNNIMREALEKGEDSKAIKAKLDPIDKQIQEIDSQISKIQLEDQRKALGSKDKNKKSETHKQTSNKMLPKNEKTERSIKEMDNLLSLSSNLSQAKALSSQRSSMSGETRVLECEIKIDESRGIDPVGKKKRVAKINENMENITEKISGKLNDVNKKINKSTEVSTSNDAVDNNGKSENLINNESTDTLLIQQQQSAQNIKVYNDNLPDKANHNGEKINAKA